MSVRILLSALGILLCVLVVACVDDPQSYVLAQETYTMPSVIGEFEREEIIAWSKLDCECQRGHWGRELVATICQSGLETPTRGCLYQRGKSIYWANEQREAGPI